MKRCIALLFFCFIISSTLGAYPYRFRRLIYKDYKEEYNLTVDLISDQHLFYPEPIKLRQHREVTLDEFYGCRFYKRESQFRNLSDTFLINDLYTQSERALRKVLLDKITNKNGEAITLLWEGTVALCQNEKPSSLPTVFLASMYDELKKELATNKKVNEELVDTNLWRNIFTQGYEQNLDLNTQWAELTQQVEQKFTQLKNRAPKEVIIALQEEWDEIQKKLTPYLKPEATLKSVAENVGMNFLLTLTAAVMDLETLFNIFILNKKHFIVYAGGAHTREIAKVLKKIGFTEVIDVGFNDETYLDYFSVPVLDHTAWQLLQENPIRSLHRKKGTMIRAVKSDLFRPLALDYSLPSDSEEILLEKFKKAQKELAHSFVSIGKLGKVKTDVFTGNPEVFTIFEMALRKKMFKLADFLLQHGALIDVGIPSPLQKAVERNDAQLVAWLLQRGARRRVDAKVLVRALTVAIEKKNEEMILQLLELGVPVTAENIQEAVGNNLSQVIITRLNAQKK